MKKFKALRVVSVFAVLILLSFVGCTDKGGVTPNPTPDEPSISITEPDRVWYGDGVSIPYVATGATKVMINGLEKPLSGVFTIEGLTANTVVKFKVYNGSKFVVKDVFVWVCEEVTTHLARLVPGKDSVWRWTTGRIFWNGGWDTARVTLCEPVRFRSDMTGTAYYSQCNPNQTNSSLIFGLGDGTITYGDVTFSIVYLSDTVFTRSVVNNVGQTVEETFTRR